MSDHTITELDSGLRVVTEYMPNIRSAALGFFVLAGSRGEAESEAGLSHFLEHLLFKGTDRYESAQIDRLFDGWGAELNAGTDKESTTVYARMLDERVPDAFDVMADMVWRPAFRDVDPEREVVLEEIAMYEDDPQDLVFDVLGEAVFGSHPIGRPIIGRAPVIAETPVDTIRAFHARRYLPSHVVVAAAGHIDHSRVVELASRTLGRLERDGEAPAPDAAPRAPEPTIRFQRKDTEQVHVCLGAVGLPRGDDRRFAMRVLDAIFGGLSSSRLFQSVREERGLAYSVYSFTGQYQDTGQIGLYVGTRPDNLAEAMNVVQAELERMRSDPAREEELVRAKDNVKARIVLSMESSSARMNRLGGSVLFGLPILDPEEIVERVDAVTVDDLRSLASELWPAERLSAAGIGPDEDAFRAAVADICPGAAGRMGQTVCDAVSGADDLELTGRADPSLDTPVSAVLPDADVLVDFTIPDQVVGNVREALAAGVHCVVGTTGYDMDALRAAVDAGSANCFVAPNFAIGAVLMMQFAAEAARVMQAAEIVEYHHPAKLDKPSGTAARTAALMEEASGRGVPVHSVRLPGIVADQEVIVGDVAQTLRITHVTTDRTSFMPGVLLAVRRVADLPERLTIGLEHLL